MSEDDISQQPRINAWPDFDVRDPGDRFWCECGHPKPKHRSACERCTYLDGQCVGRALAIAALRHGPATIVELTVALHGRHTQTLGTGVLKLLQRMEADGRVQRYWQDETAWREQRAFQHSHVFMAMSSGRWVYSLKTERRTW